MQKLFSVVPLIEGERITLRRITGADAAALERLAHSAAVYRYLPTFLYEQKYPEISRVISGLYTECFRESIILGVYLRENGCFCGIGEIYGYRDEIHKASIGYRLLDSCWGRGIATETAHLLTDYLLLQTDIEIITASTMVENRASARVLTKNGFTLVKSGVDEDWGYPQPTIVDKWFL